MRNDNSVPAEQRVQTWLDGRNEFVNRPESLRTGFEQERGNICQPAALGQQGVRGRVRISTYTVTKLVKGKLVESEVGSSLQNRKAETAQSAIHTESMNRERGNAQVGLRTSATMRLSKVQRLQNSSLVLGGKDREETKGARLIRSQTCILYSHC